MTNIDHAIEDTLLWLESLRDQASEATPTHTAREASLTRQLVREYHQAHGQITNDSARLEANWLMIRERLQVAEAAHARDVARSGSAKAASGTGNAFRDQVRKVGSMFGTLHLGTRLFVASVLIVGVAVIWSQWRAAQTSDDSTTNVGEPYLRGDENTQRITQANPTDFADRLMTTLRSHNVTARRVDLVDDHGKLTGAIHLQAKIPPDSDAIAVLKSLGITVQKNNRLDLVIVAGR